MSTQIAENDPENLRYSVSSGPNTPHFASLPEFAKRWFVYGKGGELWEREEDAPSGLRSYIQEMGMVLPWFGATGWAATGVGADATMRVTRRHTWGAAPFYVEAWRRGGFFFEPGEESTRWGGLLASKAGVRREKPENPWICAPLSAYRPRTVPPPDAAGAFESYLHMADFRDWKFSEWLIYLSHDELRSCQAKNFLRSNQFECRHLLDQYFWLTNRHNLYARFTQLNRGVRPLPLPPGREDEWA